MMDLIDTHPGHVSSLSLITDPDKTLMLMSFSAGEGISPMAYPNDTLYLGVEGDWGVQLDERIVTVPTGSVLMVPAMVEHGLVGDGPFKLLQISL